MEIENQVIPNILSKNILKEIEALPKEFREKSDEVRELQVELNKLRSNYSRKENQINIISKEIINLENDLTKNLTEISKMKCEQKLMIESLNEEYFKMFRENFYKIPKNYQEIILTFLKYEGNYKEELNFLLIKNEYLHQLIKDSYAFYKSLADFDRERYQFCQDKINNLKNGEISLIGNNKKYKLKAPFDLIINFIDNTFRIIDTNKYNREMNINLIEKNNNKQNLFMQNKISEQIIKEKQEKLNNINIYIKHINNILIKYKNFFGNSSVNKNNNSNNIKNISNNRYDNDNNSENFGNNNILFERQKKSNNNLKINNDNILLNSNINNSGKYKNNNKDKIMIKTNIKKEDKVHKKNHLNFTDNKNNNSKNINNTSIDQNSSINNQNNIKIISIITSSNKNLENPNNKKNTNNKINIENNLLINSNSNSNSIDYFDKNKNKNKHINDFSATNPKEGKKIKIGSLSMYQASTSKNYKNKIIKTNSFEQVDSRKIFMKKPISNNEQNKSYTEIAEYGLLGNNNKKIKNNQYKERNVLRSNKKFYYSYQLNDAVIENKNKEKSIKEEEKEKITIVENYNQNNGDDYKNNENNENNDVNRRKNFYLSPGIYNNNSKILKMLQMNKNNDKNKNKNK